MSARIRVSRPEYRTMDGRTFASKAEMNRYAELRMMERAGLIRDLELQPAYVLLAPFTYRGEKMRGITYLADFRYQYTGNNRIIVEDVKGMHTEVYRMKKKLLLSKYPEINFVEVKV